MAESQIEEKIFLARVAEQAERHDDMISYLTEVLGVKGASVNADERNLLSVAFKNLISGKRAACRTITAIEQNPQYAQHSAALAAFKQKIKGELEEDCNRIISIVQENVLTPSCEGEPKAFFVKMVGDYYRYVTEVAEEDRLEEIKQKALEAYSEANAIELPPCNPIKLGLALNFSVFYYEAMKDHPKAIELADKALSEALEKIDELNEKDFNEAKSIIELLKENLTLWREEEGGTNEI